jgi:hypothetical protein
MSIATGRSDAPDRPGVLAKRSEFGTQLKGITIKQSLARDPREGVFKEGCQHGQATCF